MSSTAVGKVSSNPTSTIFTCFYDQAWPFCEFREPQQSTQINNHITSHRIWPFDHGTVHFCLPHPIASLENSSNRLIVFTRIVCSLCVVIAGICGLIWPWAWPVDHCRAASQWRMVARTTGVHSYKTVEIDLSYSVASFRLFVLCSITPAARFGLKCVWYTMVAMAKSTAGPPRTVRRLKKYNFASFAVDLCTICTIDFQLILAVELYVQSVPQSYSYYMGYQHKSVICRTGLHPVHTVYVGYGWGDWQY